MANDSSENVTHENSTQTSLVEKIRQLEFLAEFSSTLNVSLDPTTVRKMAIEAVVKLLRCENATVVDGAADQASSEVRLSAQKIVVPLRTSKKNLGTIQAFQKLQGPFTFEDARLLVSLSHPVAIALENAQLYDEIRRSFYETVEALVESIEKKDRYTGGHTKRVVYYSEEIASAMGLSHEEIEEVRLAAVLHDVGKIGIEDKILKKTAPLDSGEWPVMRTHPELGYQILKKVSGLRNVTDGMRFHHERFDGLGYPLGLKGESIPLMARIIAVADSYDALVSTRPYRKGIHPSEALEEIRAHAGTQFCPRVVQAFLKAFDRTKSV